MGKTMKYIEVLQYCLALPDTSKHYSSQAGNAFSLTAGDAAFAYFETGAPIQWQFVVRVTEELYDKLHNPPQVRKTDRGDGHWLVITRVENFDEGLLKELIHWSYEQVHQHA